FSPTGRTPASMSAISRAASRIVWSGLAICTFRVMTSFTFMMTSLGGTPRSVRNAARKTEVPVRHRKPEGTAGIRLRAGAAGDTPRAPVEVLREVLHRHILGALQRRRFDVERPAVRNGRGELRPDAMHAGKRAFEVVGRGATEQLGQGALQRR